MILILLLSILLASVFLLYTITKRWKRELPGPRGVPVLGSLLAFRKNPHALHTLLENWADEYGQMYEIFLGNRRLVKFYPFHLQFIQKQ